MRTTEPGHPSDVGAGGRFSLDIDDVIADFTRGFFRRLGVSPAGLEAEWKHPRDYWYSRLIPQIDCSGPEECFNQVFEHVKRDDFFWLSLDAMETQIPPSIAMYLTSRETSDKVTRAWLRKRGFPDLPLFNAHSAKRSKADIALEAGMVGHIDDKSETFVSCIEAGLTKSFLVSRPWNIEVETPRRIYRLEEIEWRI